MPRGSDASASPPEGIRGIAIAAGEICPPCPGAKLSTCGSDSACQHPPMALVGHRLSPPPRASPQPCPTQGVLLVPDGAEPLVGGWWALPGWCQASHHVLVLLLRAFTFFAVLACVADFAGAAVGAIAGQAVASAPTGAGEARVTGCLTVVAEETLWAHTEVGAPVALTLPSILARI